MSPTNPYHTVDCGLLRTTTVDADDGPLASASSTVLSHSSLKVCNSFYISLHVKDITWIATKASNGLIGAAGFELYPQPEYMSSVVSWPLDATISADEATFIVNVTTCILETRCIIHLVSRRS